MHTLQGWADHLHCWEALGKFTKDTHCKMEGRTEEKEGTWGEGEGFPVSIKLYHKTI